MFVYNLSGAEHDEQPLFFSPLKHKSNIIIWAAFTNINTIHNKKSNMRNIFICTTRSPIPLIMQNTIQVPWRILIRGTNVRVCELCSRRKAQLSFPNGAIFWTLHVNSDCHQTVILYLLVARHRGKPFNTLAKSLVVIVGCHCFHSCQL